MTCNCEKWKQNDEIEGINDVSWIFCPWCGNKIDFTIHPCPFCGGGANHELCEWGGHIIKCKECDSQSMRWSTEIEAVNAWNKRTDTGKKA